MVPLSDDARRRLLLITMNEAREPVDTEGPEARELLGRACIEIDRHALGWVRVTELGAAAIEAHYSRPPNDR